MNNLDAIRARYQASYQPVCGGCGQPMRCILWRVFRCDGEAKIGRRWVKCPAPEQWERPNDLARRDVLALLDQLEQALAGKRPGRRAGQSAAEQLRLIA